MALQAKLDTKKKAFDLAAYIRDNTPSFSQTEAKVQRQILARVQANATPQEIVSGKAQNVLLKNLEKFAGRKVPVAPVNLDEDTLKQLNVTSAHGNLGLLRNNGQFTWPGALRSLIPPDERTALEKETQALFRQAANAPQPDADRLRDLKGDLDKIRTRLVRSVNEIPTPQYLAATRFLNDFDASLMALENGDTAAYLDFQSRFAGGGKTAQELVEYMVRNGLRFAPATPGDEAAYQAAHSALVAYSVALENQVAAAKE
jgi:hypothetical protein